MRRSILVPAGALTLVFASVLLLHGQGATDMPHGDIKIDCGECHTPERWVPVDKPPTWQRAQARPACPPWSGKDAGCEKFALCQVGEVMLWQSSHRLENPAWTWLGLVVPR